MDRTAASGKYARMPDDFQNILLIKMSSMGDVLHALPALNALRERFPRATISWLVDQRFAGLIEGHRALDEVIVAKAPTWANRLSFIDHIVRGAFQFHVTRLLSRKKFDLVVDFQGLLRTGLFCAATLAPVRLGFSNAREAASLFYSKTVFSPYGRHAVQRYLELVASIGARPSIPRFDLPIRDLALADVDARLASAGIRPERPVALIAPQSSRPAKNWRLDRFSQVVRYLWDNWGLQSVIVGGCHEAEACNLVARTSGCPAVAITGEPMDVLVAMISRARLVVGLDSGPVHLAAALGKPVISIFGPTEPGRFSPWGFEHLVVERRRDCLACHIRDRARIKLPGVRHTCLARLKTKVVLETIDRELRRDRAVA